MDSYIFIGVLITYIILIFVAIGMHLRYTTMLNSLNKERNNPSYSTDLGVISPTMLKDIFRYRTANQLKKESTNPKTNSKIAFFSIHIGNLRQHFKYLTPDSKKALLKEVINRIRNNTHQTDFIAKTDTNNFYLLVLDFESNQELELLAEQLISSLSSTYEIDDITLEIAPAIGISSYPDQGTEADILINNANTARNLGVRNNTQLSFYTDPDTRQKEDSKYRLTQEMKTAIKEKQFILYYQPQYDIQTNKVIGVEALVRWNHPKRGYIQPIDFIPLAESTGLILPLGDWILEEACNQYIRWNHPDLIMSVNLSAAQFTDPNLIDIIKRVLTKTHIPPNKLNLEITETTSMQNVDQTIKTLQQIRDLGILISIDDFGVGYSSLSYITKFPVTHLKIDRSFVVALDDKADPIKSYANNLITKAKHQQTTTPTQGELMVKSIISMAQGLGIRVIAEGVENEQQLSYLKQSNCNEIQGYILSPPLPSDMFNQAYLSKKLTLSPSI